MRGTSLGVPGQHSNTVNGIAQEECDTLDHNPFCLLTNSRVLPKCPTTDQIHQSIPRSDLKVCTCIMMGAIMNNEYQQPFTITSLHI